MEDARLMSDMSQWVVSPQYTAKNATDLFLVVNFTDLLQLVNKFYQNLSNPSKSVFLQLLICRLAATFSNNLQQA